MFKAKQYRDQANKYAERRKAAPGADEAREFSNLEKSFTTLADNDDWLSANHQKMVHAPSVHVPGAPAMKDQEEHLLRCLGAALIMHWDPLPSDIRRELFDSAATMGDASDVVSLRKRIARFLHLHQDEARPPLEAL
jgi:hypothetical protein